MFDRLPVFDPDVLHQAACSAKDLSGEKMIAQLKTELVQRYPGHINPRTDWVFSNAGGCMWVYTPLHASVAEYLLVWGAPVGTQGHTGRHLARIWDFVMDGEVLYYDEESPFTRLEFHTGETRYDLAPWVSQGLTVPHSAWVLEYARGFIPSMLPFGFADSLLSALDVRSVCRSVGMAGEFYTRYVGRLATGRARLTANRRGRSSG